MKAIDIDDNNNFNNEKEVMKYYKMMTEGEITEDEFKEEVDKINKAIEAKKRKIRQEDMDEFNEEKNDKESYQEYFHNNKKEFRNILGI